VREQFWNAALLSAHAEFVRDDLIHLPAARFAVGRCRSASPALDRVRVALKAAGDGSIKRAVVGPQTPDELGQLGVQ
jgi:hypothetical protein